MLGTKPARTRAPAGRSRAGRAPDRATKVPLSKKCKLDIKRKHIQHVVPEALEPESYSMQVQLQVDEKLMPDIFTATIRKHVNNKTSCVSYRLQGAGIYNHLRGLWFRGFEASVSGGLVRIVASVEETTDIQYTGALGGPPSTSRARRGSPGAHALDFGVGELEELEKESPQPKSSSRKRSHTPRRKAQQPAVQPQPDSDDEQEPLYLGEDEEDEEQGQQLDDEDVAAGSIKEHSYVGDDEALLLHHKRMCMEMPPSSMGLGPNLGVANMPCAYTLAHHLPPPHGAPTGGGGIQQLQRNLMSPSQQSRLQMQELLGGETDQLGVTAPRQGTLFSLQQAGPSPATHKEAAGNGLQQPSMTVMDSWHGGATLSALADMWDGPLNFLPEQAGQLPQPMHHHQQQHGGLAHHHPHSGLSSLSHSHSGALGHGVGPSSSGSMLHHSHSFPEPATASVAAGGPGMTSASGATPAAYAPGGHHLPAVGHATANLGLHGSYAVGGDLAQQHRRQQQQLHQQHQFERSFALQQQHSLSRMVQQQHQHQHQHQQHQQQQAQHQAQQQAQQRWEAQAHAGLQQQFASNYPAQYDVLGGVAGGALGAQASIPLPLHAPPMPRHSGPLQGVHCHLSNTGGGY